MPAAETAPSTSPARARLAELIGRRARLTEAMASQIQSTDRLKGMIGIEAEAQAELDAFDKAAGAAMEQWLRSGGAAGAEPAPATGRRRKLVQALEAAAGQASAARSATASIEADYLKTATEANAMVPLIDDAVAEIVAQEAAPLLEEARGLRSRLASTLAKLNYMPAKLFELAEHMRPRLDLRAAHHSRSAEGLKADIVAAAAPIAGPMAEAEEARKRLDDLCTRLATDAASVIERTGALVGAEPAETAIDIPPFIFSDRSDDATRSASHGQR
jgi:plasmid stability protein